MKKFIIIVVFVIGTILGLAFVWLMYKTWTVFGFWTIFWTGAVTGLTGLTLGQLVGSRVESNGKITYNPKEWPKLIHIIVCGLVGYYLYTIISGPEVQGFDYYYGISYLIFLTALPILWSTYKLFRDRNDFVEIDEKFISYRDNKKTGKFEISNISKIDGVLTLHFNDETTHEIDLKNMNFNTADGLSLIKDIESRLPKKVESENTPDDNGLDLSDSETIE
jgi:hypothetical protein